MQITLIGLLVTDHLELTLKPYIGSSTISKRHVVRALTFNRSMKIAALLAIVLLGLNALRANAQWQSPLVVLDNGITSIVETTSGEIFVATLLGQGMVYHPATGTWSEVDNFGHGEVWDFYAHPDGHVILDNGDDLLYSQDGGSTWEFLAPFGEIEGFSYFNNNWIVSKGDGGALYQTVNAGQEWNLANHAALPAGIDDYSSDAVYNGSAIVYLHTEDEAEKMILRRDAPFGAFGQFTLGLDRVLLARSNGFSTFFGAGEIALHSSSNLIDWNTLDLLPFSQVSEMVVKNNNVVVLSPEGIAVFDEPGEDWLIVPYPAGTITALSAFIDSADHLLLGTDCCLFRSEHPIRAINTSTGVPADLGLVVGSVFPNPALTGAALPLTSEVAQSIVIDLIDLAGRSREIFRSPNFIGSVHVPLPADLSSGVYLIRVQTPQKSIVRRLAMVN